MAKKSTDVKAAMNAINRSLNRFDMPTRAMSVAAVAGVYAAHPKGVLKRYAGIGVSIETLITAFLETAAFDQDKRKQRRKSK